MNSGLFSEVMVSTDSREIASIAEQYGAEVPFMRSDATSNDRAITAEVLKEVIENYSARGKTFDFFCCIYPTAPFVSAERLREANGILLKEGADALLPVVKFSFPTQRGMVIKEKRVQFQYPEYETSRSQDLEPVYHDCGQFYFCRTDALLKYNTMIPPDTIPMVLPEEEVQDIDNLSDWKLAEVKYRLIQQALN